MVTAEEMLKYLVKDALMTEVPKNPSLQDLRSQGSISAAGQPKRDRCLLDAGQAQARQDAERPVDIWKIRSSTHALEGS